MSDAPLSDVRISIPHPIKLERMWGQQSLMQNGRPLTVRLTHDDIDRLNEVAEKIGIAQNALMRWLIVYGMRELYMLHFNQKIEVRP